MRAVAIAAIVAWSAAPIVIGVLTSVSTQAEAQATPAVLVPQHATLDAYRALLTSNQTQGGVRVPSEASSFGTAMTNSGVITLEATLALLVIAILAGYGFSRLRFYGRGAMLWLLLGTLVVPVFAIVIPLFRAMADLNLIDTHIGLMLIYISADAPLAVWLFYNYCHELPTEPEEASLIDGCTRFQAFYRVMLPQMGSGIAALAAILMLSIWSQFLIPLLFAPTLNTKPVTVLITEFVGRYSTNYPLQAAAGVLAMLPPAVVALVLNRYIRGLLGGFSG